MNRLEHKQTNANKRAHRVRTIVRGTTKQPRLSVHVSNLHITAQIIDDADGSTVAYASTVGKNALGSKTEKAVVVGKEIATKAKKAKIKRVSFDRGARKYHGRIKALADTVRAEGLEF